MTIEKIVSRVRQTDKGMSFVSSRVYQFSMDLSNKKNKCETFVDGKAVNPTMKNISKCLSYMLIGQGEKDESNIFFETAKYLGYMSRYNFYKTDISTAEVVLALKNHPELEVLFDTYGNFECIHGIDLDMLHKDETMPHKILGLSKKTWELYQEVRKRDKNISSIFPQIVNIYSEYGTDMANAFLKMRYQLYEVCKTNIAPEDFIFFVVQFKYNTKRLTEYLRNDICNRQGIASPSEGLILLRDYIRMCQEMNCEYEKYPKSLKLVHDIAMRNYQITFDEADQKAFAEAVANPEYARFAYTGKDFIVVPPESIESIVQEAKSLHHCADSYIRSVIRGYTMLFFMRKKSNPEKSWVTIEVSWGRIRQYAGFGDEVLDKDTVEKINEWKTAKKLR